ncbi:sigma-70 family RNA polymerase sigma factor [Streptomyces litchfieldiae]|uniref:Sigma-70 family RNA polymerase sigma factor n=1 Tax=Streptomyces litchfieldiae TaxID=3075543 RepID=A0ABU2MZ23_9ACTN|nr:sigma-70 family RNA polymerase sigma factor [Streptomyces sp. DSM 44938]MDT0345759.1 sigma-70 family RNA polymerase sigma factor [Streptomyces sp. DSM 44938]
MRIQGTAVEPDRLPGASVVAAARAGDRAALDKLVRAYLPLVYNIVGRGLNGHPDVDDVVQETLLRAVRGIGDLADPERFRSWLVAIAVRQMRDRWRAARPEPAPAAEAGHTADPGSDFVGLTILRLELSGQRREIAEATRWLDDEERGLLSLWWQEAAGQLTRAELAAATGVSAAHAGVRVQRMRGRLDMAREVVRALRAKPRCSELGRLTADWNGVPSALWRKRLARHVRECPRCAAHAAGLAPAEGLLAGLALVPLPAGFMLAGGLLTGTQGAAVTAGAVGKLAAALTAKPAALAVAGATVVAAGLGAYTLTSPSDDPAGPPAAAPSEAGPGNAAEAPAPGGSPSDIPETPPETGPESAPPEEPDAVYGQTVDGVDAAPDPNTPPAPLPERPEGRPVTAAGGVFQEQDGDRWLMTYRDEHLVLSGQGYFQVRYQLGTDGRRGGMVMPTWTGLEGRLFHVASGGGRRMDDQQPGLPEGTTWMGSPPEGYLQLPDGAQQMWQTEYFHLDGSVTLTNHERGADYNLIVTAVTHDAIAADLGTPPDPAASVVRYGLVRDTGDDRAPVPQYLTRSRPADPAAVAQHSQVGPE